MDREGRFWTQRILKEAHKILIVDETESPPIMNADNNSNNNNDANDDSNNANVNDGINEDPATVRADWLRVRPGMVQRLGDQALLAIGDTTLAFFDDSDSAIVGVYVSAEHGPHLVYQYELLVQQFQVENDWHDAEVAEEFVDFNTVRAIYYMGKNHPIIIRRGRFHEDDAVLVIGGMRHGVVSSGNLVIPTGATALV